MLLMRKYDEENSACLLSHPVRGAWIEILLLEKFYHRTQSRTPSGVRGLKYTPKMYSRYDTYGRTPSGVRGLKSRQKSSVEIAGGSHPVRGAWIEIAEFRGGLRHDACRTPSGVRGLKSSCSSI